MHIQQRRKPAPQCAERAGVGRVDLFDYGEQLALIGVVVEDDLGDVHEESRAGIGPGLQIELPPKVPAGRETVPANDSLWRENDSTHRVFALESMGLV